LKEVSAPGEVGGAPGAGGSPPGDTGAAGADEGALGAAEGAGADEGDADGLGVDEGVEDGDEEGVPLGGLPPVEGVAPPLGPSGAKRRRERKFQLFR